jgi:hypothetical protein
MTGKPVIPFRLGNPAQERYCRLDFFHGIGETAAMEPANDPKVTKTASTSAEKFEGLSAESLAGLRMLAAYEAMSFPVASMSDTVKREINEAVEEYYKKDNKPEEVEKVPPPPKMTPEELEGLRQLAAWENM